jgi:hypothetical protein
MIEAYPLCWPVGYPRTEYPEHNSAFFQTTVDKQRKELLRELKLLKASDVIISTNIPLRLDGMPYSDWNRRSIQDKGVAVYFNLDGQPSVLCCDAWNLFEDNFRALVLTINAMRGIDRWKVSEVLKRTFSGFKALPMETEAARDVWFKLGLEGKPATKEALSAAYKKKALIYHPDNPRTGDSNAMSDLGEAYQIALKFFQ